MPPSASTPRCPTTSGTGNLTALRELALLWLADQVDAALAKYRADNKITDTWEARERVVVAVTGGPESETLVRRAFRIASKSSAELMVVHVVRGDGLSGVSAPADGQGARAGRQPRRHPAHRRRRRRARRAAGLRPRDERHATGARHLAAVAVGAHLRRGHRRDGRAAVRARSTCTWSPTARPSADSSWSSDLTAAPAHGLLARRTRGPVGHLRGHRLAARPVPRHRRGERAVLHRRAGRRAARRRRAGRAVGGAVRACCSTTSSSSRATRSPSPNPTARSPSSCCWRSPSRSPRSSTARPNGPGRPRLASQEAELLALFAGSVLRGADLEHAAGTGPRDVLAARREHAARHGRRPEASSRCVGEDPCVDADSADTAIEVGDDEFWMLMAGSKLAARDRRVLTAVAKQAAGLVKQRELDRGGGQGRGHRPGRRAAPLTAVGRQPRPAHAAGRRQGRGVQPAQRRRRLLRRGHRRTARHRRGVHRPADRARRQPARLVAAGGGRGRPDLRRVYLEETVQRALVGISKHPRVSRVGPRPGEGRGRRRRRDGRQRTARAGAGQRHRQRAALRARQPGAGHRGHGRRPGADRRHRRGPRYTARHRGAVVRTVPAARRPATTPPASASASPLPRDSSRRWAAPSRPPTPPAAD